MNNLPSEILTEIFSYFTMKDIHETIAHICKIWHSIAWDTPKLNRRYTIETDSDFVKLLTLPSKHVKIIHVQFEISVVNKFFEDLSSRCPFISHLTIDRSTRLAERHFHRLGRCFPHLQHIDVFSPKKFIDEHYIKILQPLKSVVFNNHIGETTLQQVTLDCPKLESLHMYGHVRFYPLPQLNNLLTARYDQLNALSLRCHELDDRTCSTIAQCLNLQHLRLYHGWLVTDKGLSNLEPMRPLQTLHITGLKLVTNAGFENFITSLKMEHLTDVNFSCTRFSDEHGVQLARKSHRLKELELWNCPEMSTDGLALIARESKMLQRLYLNMLMDDRSINDVIGQSNVNYVMCDYITSFNDCNIFTVKNVNDGIWTVQRVDNGHLLSIVSAFKKFGEVCYRGSGEGFKSNLFYYSQQYKFQYIDSEPDRRRRATKRKYTDIFF